MLAEATERARAGSELPLGAQTRVTGAARGSGTTTDLTSLPKQTRAA